MWNADLSGSNLTGALMTASISESLFDGAVLDSANASGTYGWFARLINASIVGADFSGASLYASDWSYSTVTGVDFTNTDLWSARFSGATLSGNVWSNTFCPSGVNSDDNGGNCNGQFTHGAPAVEG
ncbi:MAG: pentapeptide repeat-containing protein [Acidimicrobiales bacterium]